jgi:anti-sigma-K factor RskA
VSPDERDSYPESCGANAAPYVLGALSERESEAFRRHMDSCIICREEVASLRVVASALPAAAPQLTAPSDLKRRVMGAVHADARGSEHAEPRRLRRRARSGRRPAFVALAVAAPLAVAAVLAVLAVGLLAPSGGGGRSRVIRAEVHAPRATALLRLADGQAQLTISGLPQPARYRVYEVWLKRSGTPQPTDALFTVSSSGDATVGVPGVGKDVREVMVTSEPLGGSRQPTSPPLIVARVS